ncbi:MAG TPA: hypothetical protein VN936_05215 [Candidatus Acidoferrum sp.]|jgi:hypothetical protein|nr:hypothetical protein [Candidatus Acidoferrum sp.]
MKGGSRRDWGESVTLLVALAVFVATRDRYTIGGPAITLGLGIVLALMCCVSIAVTWLRPSGSRPVMVAAAGVLAVGVITSMLKVLYLVVYRTHDIQGERLLLTALVIWIGNVIVFAVIYERACPRDFAFPKRESESSTPMQFLDYLFLSFTTSTAFSPTDTSPLSTRARMYMMAESTISLATIAIAAARAVNILS